MLIVDMIHHNYNYSHNYNDNYNQNSNHNYNYIAMRADGETEDEAAKGELARGRL